MTESLNPAALLALPIFPLGQLVLFPETVVPLHIFEPRYRMMLLHCMQTHRALAIAHVPDPANIDAEGQPRVAEVAGVGIIVAHDPLPDGRSNILVRGHARVTLQELPFVAPFRRAHATLRTSEPWAPGAAERTLLVSVAMNFVQEVRRMKPEFDFSIPEDQSLEAAIDLCAHCLLFRAEAKQAALEERNVEARHRMLVETLVAQTHAIKGARPTIH